MRSDDLLLLDRDTVANLLTPELAMAATRRAFVAHASKDGENFPLVRQKLDQGIFGIKSGVLSSESIVGFKAAGYWPGNTSIHRDRHQATVMLFDPATGRPCCLIDGNAVTTMRTGAAGAVGISTLARPDSSRLCVFGVGVQARVQAQLALGVLASLRCITYLTRSGQADRDFESAFDGIVTVIHSRSPNDAVRESDVVITATPATTPLFQSHAITPGTHINCVGADSKGKRELPVLSSEQIESSRLFVDDDAQSREVGEMQWIPDVNVTEIGTILRDTTTFERNDDDTTIFDMTGMALQDLALAGDLYREAVDVGAGRNVKWPW